MKSLRLLILALIMWSSLIQAAPVTYYFGGALSQVQTALAPHFSIDDAFSGSLTFDSLSHDINPDIFRATYTPGPAFSATVNAIQFATTGGGAGSVGVDNNFGGHDFLNIRSALSQAEMPPEIGGYLPISFGLLLRDSSGTTFIDDALPLGGLNLNNFDIARFAMDFVGSSSTNPTIQPLFASIIGELSYISLTDPTNNSSVPEPSSMLLVTVGIGALAVIWRKAAM